MKKICFLGFQLLLMLNSAMAAVKTQTVEYASKNTALEGVVAYSDDASQGTKPGILIIHDWMGIGPFTEEKAKKLAKEGYVAFAIDVYGKGVHPRDEKEAGSLASKYKGNRVLLRERVRAAYDKLIAMKGVDPHKIVVMGYCFGGTAALELARSGAPLAGTVVFHGGLSNPTPEDAKHIKGKVLVMQGADDPIVGPAEVNAFKEEMQKAGVDMVFIAYPGAVHAYTNPHAGNDKSKGVAYNAQADKKSWDKFETFLKNIF